MRVDVEACIGCGECIPYCPMNALAVKDEHCMVDEKECVECNICYYSGVCPVEALQKEDLTWPREVRSVFSDPLQSHSTTGVPGRGTEEMKTNDVTGRFRAGYAGIAVELGRPGTGTRFRDVEKVAMAVATLGVKFEDKNPVTSLMTDRATGKIRDDVLEEKALSAIVEFDAPLEMVPEVLKVLRDVSSKIDTVFSLDLACWVNEENKVKAMELAMAAGYECSGNGKTNAGLGRPLANLGK
ncbi:MAG: 4Fe-4S binding protein [Firmicutes bacterium]|nr:4Fe-4S binding protein [Bacillota bacterium]